MLAKKIDTKKFVMNSDAGADIITLVIISHLSP
jgi:hypothetical protein